VVLYGYETLSLKLRDEHKLRVFENRVLRRIFGLRGDEVIGGWRKLHNEELQNLYSSPSIIRMVKSRRIEFVSVIYCILRDLWRSQQVMAVDPVSPILNTCLGE
jgi:hypothetical protein